MEFSKIPGFAVEKNYLEFDGLVDWFIAYNDIYTLWNTQPSFMCVQLLFIAGSFITLYHAVKFGGRFKQLWIGILLHGIFVEGISYNLPDVDSFWHSQTAIIFLGRRLPLYIIALYLVFDYTATIVVDKLNLPWWSESLAVGLVTVLLDYPFDVIATRYIFWTWHDTDPNIFDRHYFVPWNSFFFHIAFADSFNFWFHFTRRLAFGESQKWKSNSSTIKECICTIISVFLGMPGGVLIFALIYHSLHDIYNVHSEVTFFLMLTISLSLIWLSLPINTDSVVNRSTNKYIDFVILLYWSFYYLVFIGIVIFVDPASEISIGWHEPIGPCNETTPIYSALGHILYKRKYLCPTDHDETCFSWSCLPNGKPPSDGAHWYTVCGTPWTNKIEYIVILSAIAILGISFLAKILTCDFSNNHKPEGNFQVTYTKQKIKSNYSLK